MRRRAGPRQSAGPKHTPKTKNKNCNKTPGPPQVHVGMGMLPHISVHKPNQGPNMDGYFLLGSQIRAGFLCMSATQPCIGFLCTHKPGLGFTTSLKTTIHKHKLGSCVCWQSGHGPAWAGNCPPQKFGGFWGRILWMEKIFWWLKKDTLEAE